MEVRGTREVLNIGDRIRVLCDDGYCGREILKPQFA